MELMKVWTSVGAKSPVLIASRLIDKRGLKLGFSTQNFECANQMRIRINHHT